MGTRRFAHPTSNSLKYIMNNLLKRLNIRCRGYDEFTGLAKLLNPGK